MFKSFKNPGKGKIKCFQCGTIVKVADGNWVSTKTQEVFICLSCGKKEASQSTNQIPSYQK